MKTKLQELVESLVIKHGFGLDWADSELELSLPDVEHHLLIEPLDKALVNISFATTTGGGGKSKPYEILFYTRDAEWVFIDVETPECSINAATLESRLSEYFCSSVFAQEEAIAAITEWTEQLYIDGWLENAIVVPPSNEPAYRPTFSDLAAWMEQGGCEATDGCWVEPDGYCTHGYPSWLLHLNLI